MKLKKRYFFWLGALLCLLVLLILGYHYYSLPHQSAGAADADYSLEADSLYAQYQRDENGANRKYLGKVLEVRGAITDIQTEGQSEIWILSGQPGGGGVNCRLFEPEHPSRRKIGDRVRVKGRCTGFLMDVALADCVAEK